MTIMLQHPEQAAASEKSAVYLWSRTEREYLFLMYHTRHPSTSHSFNFFDLRGKDWERSPLLHSIQPVAEMLSGDRSRSPSLSFFSLSGRSHLCLARVVCAEIDWLWLCFNRLLLCSFLVHKQQQQQICWGNGHSLCGLLCWHSICSAHWSDVIFFSYCESMARAKSTAKEAVSQSTKGIIYDGNW